MHYGLYGDGIPRGARPPGRVRPALVHQIPMRFARAWNRHDAAAVFADFDAEAHLVDADGSRTRGREAIVAHYAALHAGVYAQTFLRIDHVELRRTAADTAIVYADWTMRAHGDRVRRGTLLFVVARRAAGWRVVAAQNTEEPEGVVTRYRERGLTCSWYDETGER